MGIGGSKATNKGVPVGNSYVPTGKGIAKGGTVRLESDIRISNGETIPAGSVVTESGGAIKIVKPDGTKITGKTKDWLPGEPLALPAPKGGTDDVVYRGDTRDPSIIAGEGGFRPRSPGSNVSIEDYVDYNRPSDYVRTTTNRPTGDITPGSPGEFATNGGSQPGYIYEIDRPANGVDVNSEYQNGPFPHENEIAVPGGIDNQCIRGCTPVGADGSPTGDFIPNPDYTGGQ